MSATEPALGLDLLVANGTLSTEIAATLRAAVDGRLSFLVVAIPRFAGKTTLTRAMLAQLPTGTPIRTLGHDGDDPLALLAASRGGYIVVPEISRGAWAPGYVWGTPVRTVFGGLPERTGLATALHAPGVEEAFEVICRGNRVSDADAERLALVIYLRSLGPDPAAPLRRVVSSVHEVVGVDHGRARLRLLHRWNESADRFEFVAPATRVGRASR